TFATAGSPGRRPGCTTGFTGGLRVAGLVRAGVAEAAVALRRFQSLPAQRGGDARSTTELGHRRSGRRVLGPLLGAGLLLRPTPLLGLRCLLGLRRGHSAGPTARGGADRDGHRRLRGLFGLGRLDLRLEQQADCFFLQPVQHRLEQVVAFAPVFPPRVPLGPRPRPRALLRVVRPGQVPPPLAVEHDQAHAALQLAHGALADLAVDLGLALLVGLQGVLDDRVAQVVPAQVLVLLDELLPVQGDRVEALERGPQLGQIPVLGVALGGLRIDVSGDDVGEHVLDLLTEVFALQYAAPFVVDDLALLVHHLVVLEDILADLHVLLLDLGLGAADGPGDHLVLDRHVVRDLHPGHHRFDHSGVEPAHQFVAQRQVEPGFARVALPAGAAAQLVVDAAGFVAFGAEHVEAAELADFGRFSFGLGLDLLDDLGPLALVLLAVAHRVQAAAAQFGVGQVVHVAAEHDVGAAAGHVGGHGDRALAPGFGDDRGFPFVVLGVEHAVRDAALGQQLRQVFGAFHAGGADEHRLALAVPFLDVFGDRLELGLLGLVDQVGLVDADHRLVGGDRHHAEPVGGLEFGGLGLRGTGHAGELVVEPEVVLQGARGQRLVLGFDLDAFFGLDGLVHALVVAAPGQDAAGE